jgi:hypothetical protein
MSVFLQRVGNDILPGLVTVVEVAPKGQLLGRGNSTHVAVIAKPAAAAAAAAAAAEAATAATAAKAKAEGATQSGAAAAAAAATAAEDVDAAALSYMDVLFLQSCMYNLLDFNGAPGVHMEFGAKGAVQQT